MLFEKWVPGLRGATESISSPVIFAFVGSQPAKHLLSGQHSRCALNLILGEPGETWLQHFEFETASQQRLV